MGILWAHTGAIGCIVLSLRHVMSPPSAGAVKSFLPVDEVPVLTAAERARTVNAKGEYIDHG